MTLDLSCFNWRQCIFKTKLPPNAKYIAVYLSTYMNEHHDIAWPSLSRIESDTGLSHPCVLKHLRLLEAEGWLTREKGSPSKSTRYHAVFPKKYESVVGNVVTRVGNEATYVGNSTTYQVGNQATYVGNQATSNNKGITNINNKAKIRMG